MTMTAHRDQFPPDTPALARGLASSLVSPVALIALGALSLVFILVFRAWPGLDLETAGLFYDAESSFVATKSAGLVRRALYIMPWILLIIMVALYLAKASSLIRVWSPCRRGLALMALSLALGPGLLVNAILKDNVHRPRPNQIAEFGGPLQFQSAGTIEGDCPRNCSFVSGEVSVAAWTVAAALLVPISIQPMALAAALMLSGVAGLSRMSAGAHFLSDTLLAMLFTWLVIIVTWWALFGSPGAARSAAGPHRTQAAS